jgi:glutamate dehydrogenase/leucine dehydrogenase
LGKPEIGREDETMLPELVYGVLEQKLDFTGYLVIDSTIENRSSGGVRIAERITVNEVRNLARNMTLKYGFLGIPMGGAKAGIQINGTMSLNRKRLILAEFGKRLNRFIKNKFFIPGTDMGTSNEDIVRLLNAAHEQKNGKVNIKRSRGKEYTSWTMLSSATQAFNIERDDCELSRPRVLHGLEEATMAIEGFGKIGSSAGRTFSKSGAKIVAISTYKGGIYDPEGLDIDLLLDLRNECGDDLVDVYHGARRIASDRLVQLPVDILLPCAGSHTINSTNMHKIRAKVICPGANIPLTDQAEEVLFKKGIVSVPDFVSNSGAVLGNYMADYIDEVKIKEIIEKEFGQRVYNLLKLSQERNTYSKRVAIEIAIRKFNEIKRSEGKLSRLFLRAIRVLLPDAYQKIIAKPVAPYVFKGKLKQTLA